MSIIEKEKEYISPTYSRFPLEIVSGKGSVCVGSDGKEYTDLTSGIGVNAFGYCDEEWASALKKQADTLQHTSNLYYTAPSVRLAELLCEKTGFSKVFFSNSGAEANECAIKAARKYSAGKKGDGCFTIVTLKNSFHGRTLTTLAATGQDVFHSQFKPLTPGFISVTPGAKEEIENLDPAGIAGVMIECIQGEGGVNVLDGEYVRFLREYTEKKDIPLIVDEVQTGNGRTGKLYAYMMYGITPDIVSTAKGLGGGLPIGATMFSEKLDIFSPGDHGSTFGANPVSCAGALSIISRLDDEMLAEIEKKGEFIKTFLSGRKGIGEISGAGLMIGIKTEKNVKEVINGCLEKGVLCLGAKDKLRLLPPLNIPLDILKKALETIAEVCGE